MNLLESNTIRLRALEPEDIDALYTWENDTALWRVSDTVAPFSKYILRRFIENQRYDIFETRQMRLIIESKESNKPIGSVDLFDLDVLNRRAGAGIMIYDPENTGQGFAAEALSVLIRYAFQVLNLNQIYCNIAATNTKSLSLFRSKGFTVIGLKKEWTKTTSDWQDEYMLQLISPNK